MKKLMLMMVALLMLAGAPRASAGGWAVVTLDQIPTKVVVGEPLTVGFMIRQHGQTPWLSGDVRVRALHAESGAKILVNAKQDGVPGHYTAALTFDHAGKWDWAVASGLYPEWQPMPTLNVAPAPVSNVTAVRDAVSVPLSLPLLGGVIGLIGSSVGLVFWLRARVQVQRAAHAPGL